MTESSRTGLNDETERKFIELDYSLAEDVM
jgi:hypothetical protein